MKRMQFWKRRRAVEARKRLPVTSPHRQCQFEEMEARRLCAVDPLAAGLVPAKQDLQEEIVQLPVSDVESGSSEDEGDVLEAVEESHGGMLTPEIKDKDAAPACLYLATLYQQLRHEGKTLLDYYIHILEELGGYADINRSIMMVGAEGVLCRDRVMQSLRDRPPHKLGGYTITRLVDYWDEDSFGPFVSETDKLPTVCP